MLELDLTTFRITSPATGSTISAAAPPVFKVNVPLASVDGILQSVSYLAVQIDEENRNVGTSTVSPFGRLLLTNLPAGLIT